MNVFKRIIEMYENPKTRGFIVALCNSVDITQIEVMNESHILLKERCPITNIRLYSPQYASDNNADYKAHHRKLKSGAILKLKGGRATELMTPQNIGGKSPKMKCWVSPEAMSMLDKFRNEVLIPNQQLEEGIQVATPPKVKISSLTRKPVGTLADVLANPKPQQRRRAAKQGTALSMK